MAFDVIGVLSKCFFDVRGENASNVLERIAFIVGVFCLHYPRLGLEGL